MLELPTDLAPDYFDHPYVDVDEWRDQPVRHRYVHGGFTGTTTRFSLYMPPSEQYQGRFFQYVTPAPDNEYLAIGRTGEEDVISFAIASGAYFVETNGGGNPALGEQPAVAAVGAYLNNAATANYSRVIAREMYGPHTTYGYLFGGSGGGFRTMAAAENTTDVWQGFVPYVIGSPMSIPNSFSIRMHAQRVLADVLDDIVDAFEPGGSGDPYATLDDEQAAAFREATLMGFPTRAWHGHRMMGAHGFPAVKAIITGLDPSYYDDFWTVPGYLGADPTSSVHRDRVQHTTSIGSLLTEKALRDLGLPQMPPPEGSRAGVDESYKGADTNGPAGLRLALPVPVDTQGTELHVLSGAATGAVFKMRFVAGDVAMFDIANDPAQLSAIAVGDEVRVDNSAYLAAQTFHRHQVPERGTFPAWDQYRNAHGDPVPPQRAVVVGPLIPRHSLCVEQHGRISGKMIICASVYDREAYAWKASWYHDRVLTHLGADADNRVRLWYTDRALHGDQAQEGDPGHFVSYLGTLQTALRSIAEWVERGIEPPASTVHQVVDSQVVLPPTASARRGVQPVVTLTVNGADCAEVAVGDTVTLSVHADAAALPLVCIDWRLDDDGSFDELEMIDPCPTLDRQRLLTVTKPGTQFVTVRVAAQLPGYASTIFARQPHIARVRIIAR